jgi:hypothetical protein
MDDVEYATLEWVDWFNHRRLLEPIGHIPPAEFETAHYQRKMPTTQLDSSNQASGEPGAVHGPYPVVTRAQMRSGLDLLPPGRWSRKAAANRQIIAAMRPRLAAASRLLACTRSRDWPGWSGKLRSWRTWLLIARQQRSAPAEVVVDLLRPLPCEDFAMPFGSMAR